MAESAQRTVTVACKIPTGIILRTGAFKEVNVPVMGGGFRSEKQWMADGKSITLKGPARFKGEDPRTQQAGGYALNHGVDKELWDRWLADNKESPMVENQQVFASLTVDAAVSRASDRGEVRSGMEPVTPDSDVRIPKSKALKVETETDRK